MKCLVWCLFGSQRIVPAHLWGRKILCKRRFVYKTGVKPLAGEFINPTVHQITHTNRTNEIQQITYSRNSSVIKGIWYPENQVLLWTLPLQDTCQRREEAHGTLGIKDTWLYKIKTGPAQFEWNAASHPRLPVSVLSCLGVYRRPSVHIVVKPCHVSQYTFSFVAFFNDPRPNWVCQKT